MLRIGGLGRARERDLGGLAAAQVEHQGGGKLQPRQHGGGIHAALETIARIRMDAEFAAGLCDVEGFPKRQFDQHIGGALRAARRLAAHDSGKQFHAFLIRDHAHRLVEGVDLAVEREQALAARGRGGR